MRFKRRAEVGLPVKGMKPLKKLEKISHTYFASIPTLGRIPLRAVRSVMDVSPAKLHRQKRYPNHGGTGKGRYKKETSKRIGSTDHLLKVLDEILLAFAGDFGCAGEAHAPRADGGVLADFKQF